VSLWLRTLKEANHRDTENTEVAQRRIEIRALPAFLGALPFRAKTTNPKRRNAMNPDNNNNNNNNTNNNNTGANNENRNSN
jgi:hypothetical protein